MRVWQGMLGTKNKLLSDIFQDTSVWNLRRINLSWVFFCLGFLSRTFTIHRQQRRNAISLTPLYHFHPLHRHLDICRTITAESSPQQPSLNREPLVSERKLLTTKLRATILRLPCLVWSWDRRCELPLQKKLEQWYHHCTFDFFISTTYIFSSHNFYTETNFEWWWLRLLYMQIWNLTWTPSVWAITIDMSIDQRLL